MTDSPEQSYRKWCDGCGRAITMAASYCPYCGEEQTL